MCDNPKHLQPLPNIPWGAKAPWLRTAAPDCRGECAQEVEGGCLGGLYVEMSLEQTGEARAPPKNRAASLTSDSEAVRMNVTEKKRAKPKELVQFNFTF